MFCTDLCAHLNYSQLKVKPEGLGNPFISQVFTVIAALKKNLEFNNRTV